MARGEKIIGTLCKRGHNYNGTGKSLRYTYGHNPCVECVKINALKCRGSNPERHREYHRTYSKLHRAANKEKYREYHKLYARMHRLKNCEYYREYGKKRYAANPKENNERCRRYQEKNKIKIKAQHHQYYLREKSKIIKQHSDYKKRQRALNTSVAIANRLRCMVNQALKRYSNMGKTAISREYGINYEAIINHLGPHPNTFDIPGSFHIDHIVPISAFDLNDLNQVRIAFAPSNHRWLLAGENLSKSNKIIPPEEIPLELVALLESHNMGISANG